MQLRTMWETTNTVKTEVMEDTHLEVMEATHLEVIVEDTRHQDQMPSGLPGGDVVKRVRVELGQESVQMVNVQNIAMERRIMMGLEKKLATLINAPAMEDTHLEVMEDTHLEVMEDTHLEVIVEDTRHQSMVGGVSGQLVLHHVVEVLRKEVVQIQSLQMEERIVFTNLKVNSILTKCILAIHGHAKIKNALAVEDTHLEVMEDTHLEKMEDTHLQDLEKMEDTHLEVMEDTHLEVMTDTHLEVMEDTHLEAVILVAYLIPLVKPSLTNIRG